MKSKEGKEKKDAGYGRNDNILKEVKQTLKNRLEVIKENTNALGRNQDDAWQAWESRAALTWLNSDDPDRTEDEEYGYLFISSAMRDHDRWPSSGEFEIELMGEINNVIRCEMVQASIPLVDPTVNTSNNRIRYAFSPFTGTAVREVTIRPGSYLGDALAAELARALNQDLYASQILANTYIIDDATGALWDPASKAPPLGVNQFRVTWNKGRQQFVFQYVNDALLPLNSPAFALHIKPFPESNRQIGFRELTDDLFDILGMDRRVAKTLGTFDAANGTYYFINTDTTNGVFGDANVVDQRFRYSLHSNQAADLRGAIAVILDIDPLNDNDIYQVSDAMMNREVDIGRYFGIVLIRDPANSSDRIKEINNNTYPIKKYYREGRSRINRLHIVHRRPDGSVFNYGNVDHYMTLRFVVKRTNARQPMFTR